MLWFGGNHLLFKELTSVLCQMQVIVANSSTEDYPHQDPHHLPEICLGFFKPDTVQTRGLLCQTSIILTKITSDDQGSTIRWYSTGLLTTGLKPFTIKKSSLPCLMQVSVYKPPTTNTLTHKITFLTWLTYFRSIYALLRTFNTFQTSYWPETYFPLSTESNS